MRGPIVAMTMTVCTMLAAAIALRSVAFAADAFTTGAFTRPGATVARSTTIVLVAPALAAMRAIRMAACGPPLARFTLRARSCSEHGITFRCYVGRLAMSAAVRVARRCAVGMRVAAAVVISSLTTMSAVTMSSVAGTLTVAMAAAFTTRAVLCVLTRASFGHRQNFAADVVDDFKLLLHHAFDRDDFLAFRGIAQ